MIEWLKKLFQAKPYSKDDDFYDSDDIYPASTSDDDTSRENLYEDDTTSKEDIITDPAYCSSEGNIFHDLCDSDWDDHFDSWDDFTSSWDYD